MADWTKPIARLLVSVLVWATAVAPAAAPRQDPPHAGAAVPGNEAVGFDLAATVHHFYLYENGGAIEVTVKARRDKRTLQAIRAHLPQALQSFARGDFTSPAFVHAGQIPGAEAMGRLRDRIGYAYEERRDGGRIRITTRHARALAAVHEFLRFQIQNHKTGDSLEVTRVP